MNCYDWWDQSLIFPYTRLELFASYFRGHTISKVVTRLQDGVKPMELFGGSRKKNIFLWLPNPGKWLSFLWNKIISIMSFFLSLLHSLNLLGLMSYKSCLRSCLSPISKNFFHHINSSLLLTYRIFSVIRHSHFSKKFCLITFKLSQILGASYSQVFSCNEIQECPIF